MTDSQHPQSQNPSQQPKAQGGSSTPPGPSQTGTKKSDCDDPNNPSPQPPAKEPCSDPCDDTEPIPDPLPCPPEQPPCEKKPCPDWPLPPCRPVDPCDDTGDGGDGKTTSGGSDTTPQQGGGATQQGGTAKGGGTAQQGGSGSSDQSQQGNGGNGGANGGGSPKTPADQLAALKKQLESDNEKLQELEPLKASVADVQQRIQALEKTVDAATAASAAYKEFYRTTEVMAHEIECFIPTVRCQLDINDKQRTCICKAIAKIDAIVQKAKTASWNQKQKVKKLEKANQRAAEDLAWAKQWYDFLKTDLQAQIGKRRDELKALKGLADPSKDQCEVWFYLYELERLIKPDTGIKDPAWQLDQTVGTYVEYWSIDCYTTRLNEAIVMFNDADAKAKQAQTKLDQAKKLAADLDKVATDAISKRREWILKEIKASDCCGPTSKCP